MAPSHALLHMVQHAAWQAWRPLQPALHMRRSALHMRCRITRPQQRKLPSRCLLKWHLVEVVEVSLFAPEPQLGLLLVPNQ